MSEEKKRVAHPNSIKNLKPIQKGEVRNPNGRPKSMIRKVIEEAGDILDVKLSRHDVMSVTALVQSMTVSEIKRVATDSQTPGFIAVVANAILGDIKNGEMKNTQFMLEFQHGKALQAIQMEKVVREDIIDPRQLSDEEIRQRLSELRNRDIEERDFEEVV
ncbi:MAG: hypothetical protein RL621_552 [Bacteroidota bacterium]|jgi:hypothetical protein